MGRWIVTYATRIIHFTKQRLIDICAITGSIRASPWPQFVCHVSRKQWTRKTLNRMQQQRKKGQTKKERKIPFGLHFIIGKRAYLKEKKKGEKSRRKKKFFPQRTWASFPDKDKSGRKEMYTCTVQHTQAQIKKRLEKVPFLTHTRPQFPLTYGSFSLGGAAGAVTRQFYGSRVLLPGRGSLLGSLRATPETDPCTWLPMDHQKRSGELRSLV